MLKITLFDKTNYNKNKKVKKLKINLISKAERFNGQEVAQFTKSEKVPKLVS